MDESVGSNIRMALGVILTVGCLVLAAAGSSTAQTVPTVTDQAISDVVEDQLRQDHAFFTDLIDISTEDGIVNLSGRTGNLLAKERAARIAEKVKGVRAVVNIIEVVPPEQRSDAEIKVDLAEALVEDPATEAVEVQFMVEDNVVTLTGEVDSWQERILAAKVAKGVKGVKEVRNQIDVLYKVDRSDEDIRQDIVQALRWDVLVDHAMIDVKVENGMVFLSGTVGSVAEKGRATADAYVANVQGVDSEKLEVELWARDETLRGAKYKNVTDSAIRDAIAEALRKDPRVAVFNVTPEVDAGMVTLRGTVDNLKAKRAAAETARHTVGVVDVDNRLKVRPATVYDDAMLEARIRGALKRHPLVEAPAITVNVQNGVAELFGSVETSYEKSRVEDLASQIRGVVGVRNYLAVSGYLDPYPYDPYLGDTYFWDTPEFYDPPRALASDKTIAEEIEDELFWSPFVDADEVAVRVEDGRATLTGTVDSWLEYSAASENAFEGGAMIVYNELQVR